MISKEIIINNLLGSVDLNFLIASWIVAILGGTLNAVLYSKKGAKNTENSTPTKWDIWYFITDNAKRFVAGVILLFIYARFGNELMGQTLTLGLAFLIGFGIDWVMVQAYKYLTALRNKIFPKQQPSE